MTAFWQGPDAWTALEAMPAPHDRSRGGTAGEPDAPEAPPAEAKRGDAQREVEFVQHAIQDMYHR